jgi:hypothetical protein
MGLLARLQERSGGPRVRLGRELRGAYLDARRLGLQLRRHGAQAPYPTLGRELARLAAQAEEQAAVLANELRAVAANTDPADAAEPRGGRNHWQRLSYDLADLDRLHRRYTEIALHWDVEFPDTVAAIDGLARTTAAMTSSVRSMLARSDPHADD